MSNIYTSFWFERRNLSKDIKAVGVDNVMFETDFPHPTCLYPVDIVASALGGLGGAEIEKVLCGNAARVYNLPIREAWLLVSKMQGRQRLDLVRWAYNELNRDVVGS